MARTLTEIPEAEPRSITARVLAPLALIACILVLFLLVSGTLSGGDEDGGAGEGQKVEKQRDRPELRGETYVVAPGDTLSGIAAKAGVTQERLESLNRDLDSATLNAGQQIRLRRR